MTDKLYDNDLYDDDLYDDNKYDVLFTNISDSNSHVYNSNNNYKNLNTDNFHENDLSNDNTYVCKLYDDNILDGLIELSTIKNDLIYNNKIAILSEDNNSKNINRLNNKNEIIDYDKFDGRPIVNIKVNGIHNKCLLDTGARISVIKEELLNKIGKFEINKSFAKVRCANDSNLEIVGRVYLDIELNNIKKKIEFYIASKISPSIIGGINLLSHFNIKLMREYKSISQSLNVLEDQRNIYESPNVNDIKLKEILKTYENIIMKHKWDIGKTYLLKHEIVTNSKPIVMNPRRQPHHLIERIDKSIKEMEDNGIISKCESPWNSPLVCIKKKDSEDIRICLDYRALNGVTERPIFPIPNTTEMMDILYGAKYFSTIDLGNAFYQVELSDDSKLKTAFSTKSSQYCFNRMPFGIAAAPATFQKLMNKVLGPLNWKEAVVYLDDILIFSNSLKEHYKRIENVFEKIKEAGLKINPSKCHFLKEEIRFLGHQINANGIQTEKSKIEAIEKFESPKCVKKLRSFLGLTNYYRRFIKDYTKYSKVLESLCGSTQNKICWTNDCEEAFQNLKKELTKAPVLAFPDFSNEFILDTDASFDRIGAVLSQLDENGREKPIAYGSRAMNKHELGYCITRKELLAIFYFTQHFKHYLYGKRFKLRTDHKAITFMLKTKKPITPQFQTWINHLSSLDIQMEYRKGEEHSNADALSRTDCKTCAQCQTIHEDHKTGKLKTKILALMLKDNGSEWQEDSKEINDIKNEIENNKETKWKILNNIVYTQKDKIWIPEENTRKIITHIHELLCHAGVKKVHEYISRKFDMTNRKEKIKEIVQSCENCQKRKVLTTKTKEKVVKSKPTSLFETIHIDFCGPFNTSFGRQKYIMAIIDQFSKYIMLTAVPDQGERTVAKTLKNKWILKFGAPKIIMCDCGRSFESKLVKELAENCKSKILFSSPYHHSSNGQIERQFRTIRDAIHISLKDKKGRDWTEILPEVEFMINGTVQSTIKMSPAELVFGKKISREWYDETDKEDDEIKYVKIRQEKRSKLYKAIGENNNNDNKDDKQLIEREFKVGDLVLIKKPNVSKTEDRYEGPAKIVEKRHDKSYIIRFEGGRTIVRNVEWIRLFKPRGM